MNQKSILIGIAAFVAGTLVSGAVAMYAVNGNHVGIMNMYAMHETTPAVEKAATNSSASTMPMDSGAADLKNLSGDNFDKAFISQMIIHHQGAIEMANFALTNAKHQEIKDLAKNIVSAQTSEITQMKDWQSQWGYSSGGMMNGHDMTGM